MLCTPTFRLPLQHLKSALEYMFQPSNCSIRLAKVWDFASVDEVLDIERRFGDVLIFEGSVTPVKWQRITLCFHPDKVPILALKFLTA
jgi:hypothetical protein